METHKYRLVVFLNTKKTKEIDIVPATWLHYCNETSDTLLCKFMPPPYNKDKAKKLIEMVKNCDLPEEGWPNYPVDLVGRAHTYEDAEDKVIELENKPYAYSTDNESKAKSKALEDKKNFKFKSITKTSVCDELDQTIIDLNASMDTNQCLNESFSRQNAAEKPSDSSEDDCKKSTKKDKYARNITSLGKKYKKKEKKSSTKLYEESDSSNIEMKDTESKVSKVRKKHVIKDIEISKKSSLQDKVYFSEGNNNYEDRICNTIREYYRSLSKKIANLQGEIIQMSLLVKELQQNLEELQKRNNVESLFNCEKDNDEDNQHSLPCQDYEQFEALDEKLSLDENFRQKIIRKIFSVINKKSTVTKNVGQIVRMFLSQDLAMKFTTIKPVLGKHVFCNTKLYCCIQDVMIKLFTENDGTALTLPSFQQSVKAVLYNAKDWCGQGSIRKKNTKK